MIGQHVTPHVEWLPVGPDPTRSRREFGLTWDGVTEAGAIVVGDEIKLLISVQFSKEA